MQDMIIFQTWLVISDTLILVRFLHEIIPLRIGLEASPLLRIIAHRATLGLWLSANVVHYHEGIWSERVSQCDKNEKLRSFLLLLCCNAMLLMVKKSKPLLILKFINYIFMDFEAM